MVEAPLDDAPPDDAAAADLFSFMRDSASSSSSDSLVISIMSTGSAACWTSNRAASRTQVLDLNRRRELSSVVSAWHCATAASFDIPVNATTAQMALVNLRFSRAVSP